MAENSFCKRDFIVQFTFENKINAIALVNTYAIKYGFIDKIFAEIACQTLEIKAQRLTKLKPIKKSHD